MAIDLARKCICSLILRASLSQSAIVTFKLEWDMGVGMKPSPLSNMVFRPGSIGVVERQITEELVSSFTAVPVIGTSRVSFLWSRGAGWTRSRSS